MREHVKRLLRTLRDLGGNGECSANLPSNEALPRPISFPQERCVTPPQRSPPGRGLACVLSLLLLLVICVPLLYLLHCFNLLHRDVTGHAMPDHVHDFEEPRALPVSPLHLLPPPRAAMCEEVVDVAKFDCHPEDGATAKSCAARGCCWQPRAQSRVWDTEERRQVPLQVPYCYYPRGYGGYRYINVTKVAWGVTAFLERTFYSPYPGDVPLLRLDVKMDTKTRLHVKIYDPVRRRYEPPYPEIPQENKMAAKDVDYNIIIDPRRPGFKVVRKQTNITIFDSSGTEGLIFSEQFLQVSALLPSELVYGLGEHRSTLRLSTHWEKFTLFNHDAIPQERTNLYGSHPFYLVMEKSAHAHGVFLRNSNAMDVILQPAPAITFRTIGGVLDFYFLLGPSPGDVIAQYTQLVGRPFMPPYWGLGYHQCRFGYKTLANTKRVMERTIAAGIPMDTQWNDLDYMQRGNDFTWDKNTFSQLPDFVQHLHKLGMHYIPLIDAGIAAGEPTGSYEPYDRGLELDIFVKNQSGLPFVGKVWNKVATVWPDFTNPLTVDYWTNQLRALHQQVNFDGAWIDMNEPSNFYDGQKDGCPDNQWERPPYLPGVQGGKLSYKTVCMSAQHYAGKHYDVHNLFGFTHSIVTSFAMAEIRERRPFVISRSTFAGQGHYAGHWSGDVTSTWYDMRKTLPQLLSFSMFGVPLMGADICGFNGNTTASLCQRWVQLGAFYPFSRNHNTDDAIDQDPVALGPEVVKSARKALLLRYTLLPYLYSLFWQAHALGNTVSRPLFFEWPTDPQTYDIDEQFLWGPALMISPVLDEGKTSVSAYMPHSRWYDLHTLQMVQEDSGAGTWRQLAAPLDTIPLHVRGGYILPLQPANQTTTLSRKNPLQLLVAPDKDGFASGFVYWDDGDTLNAWQERHYSVANFSAGWGWLQGVPDWWGYSEPLVLGHVTVLGVTEHITLVQVNGQDTPFEFQPQRKLLRVGNLKLPLSSPFSVEWK